MHFVLPCFERANSYPATSLRRVSHRENSASSYDECSRSASSGPRRCFRQGNFLFLVCSLSPMYSTFALPKNTDWRDNIQVAYIDTEGTFPIWHGFYTIFIDLCTHRNLPARSHQVYCWPIWCGWEYGFRKYTLWYLYLLLSAFLMFIIHKPVHSIASTR
jgi:hypothetical protein